MWELVKTVRLQGDCPGTASSVIRTQGDAQGVAQTATEAL